MKTAGCYLIFLAVALELLSVHGSRVSAGPPKESSGRVFYTWEGFEADKCAAIWLIKRFIDANASIRFVPNGETIEAGIAFDTPDAALRRYHNISTFEAMLKHYDLSDPRLVHIGKIIHDIEINIWDRKVMTETPAVQDAVNGIIAGSANKEEIVERSIQYFDTLYEAHK